MAAGGSQGRRPDWQGGGLVRSVGGWTAVQEWRRGREGDGGDERILGQSNFGEQLRPEVEAEKPALGPFPGLDLADLGKQSCQAEGVGPEEVAGDGRRRAACRVRAGSAYLGIDWLGRRGPPLSRALGVRPRAVYRVAPRGREEAAPWQHILDTASKG